MAGTVKCAVSIEKYWHLSDAALRSPVLLNEPVKALFLWLPPILSHY